MIDPAKTYRTRDGREVRIYAVDGGGPDPVHGAVKEGSGWFTYEWKADGKYYEQDEAFHDLIEVKPKHVRWVNVYECWHAVYKARMDADTMATASGLRRLACIRIEFEEGEGL